MSGPLKISLGDEVRMQRAHACGRNHWEIIRVGMDIRLRCLSCGRSVLMVRSEFEKRVKEFVKTSQVIGRPQL
jgi:hypothetical protein